MKKLSAFISSLLIVQSAAAVVPTKAITFSTNIDVLKATSSRTAKIEAAGELIKQVIASEEFRTGVLNFKFNGKTQFNNNDGYTNSEIYNIVLDGAEELNRVKDNEMDLPIETYYESSSTVGYTSTGTSKVYMNTKFLDQYTPAEASGNMMHEWLHKLGFSHAVSYSTSRDYSVPYGIGYLMARLAVKAGNGTLDGGSSTTPLQAASNLAVSTTSTQLTLKWSAASSSSGIASYKVYRVLSGSTTAYLQGTTTSLSYSQTKPTSSASYYVKATDKNGKTINSEKVSFTAAMTSTLQAPTNLKLMKSTTKVTLSWSAASGAKTYKVYRILSGSKTAYVQGTVTGTSFSQTRPKSNTSYYVRSVDASGKTLKSASITFTK
jgi:hypothetical protein